MGELLEIILWILIAIASNPKRFLALIGAIALFVFTAFGLSILPLYSDEPSVRLEFWLFILMAAGGILLMAWAIVHYVRETPTKVRRPNNRQEAYDAIERLRTMAVHNPEYLPLAAVNWQRVDLHGLDLADVNMRQAGLEDSNLRAADLHHACLRSARLEKANLSGADLRGADLQYARLNGADLREARLNRADLRAADLTGALLRDASFNGATFDKFTTLPDGRKWSPGTDLSVYGVASEHRRKPKVKLKLKRQPYFDDEQDEERPPAWVEREGKVLKIVAKRYPPPPQPQQ